MVSSFASSIERPSSFKFGVSRIHNQQVSNDNTLFDFVRSGLGRTVIDTFGTAVTPPGEPIVRIAELEIDPGQIAAYREALKEEIAASIRIEPGVLTLYAVSVKSQPNQVRIFETYKDQAAYESHIQTPHFKKYKAATLNMVKSLKLIETEPIILGRK